MKSVLVFVAAFLFLTASSAQEESPTPAPAAPVEAPAPVATPTPIPTPTPATVVMTPPPETPVPSLRKRQHAMSWQYKSAVVRSEFTPLSGTPTTSDTSRGEMSFNYFYNWGHFELGVGVGSILVKDNATSDSDSVGSFAVGGMVNFIENAPGNNLIPYIGFSAGSIAENIEVSGSKTRLLGGTGTFAFGLKWFPLEEIFAVDVSFAGNSTVATVSGASAGDYTARSGGFNVGFLLYF